MLICTWGQPSTAVDYVAVVEGDPVSRSLVGLPAVSPWEKLASVMSEHGLAVEEEAVAEMLANDLVTGYHSR